LAVVEIAELGGQRMQDYGSRLVGLDGMAVRGVHEVGDRFDLEVELVARAGRCPGCGRGSLTIKDRPMVRVRDLPVAGRATYLLWRKRRWRCVGCERTFTETIPSCRRGSASPRPSAAGYSNACAAAAPTPRSLETSRPAATRSRARSATAAITG
jgi:transposase